MISGAEAEQVREWLRRHDYTQRSVLEGAAFGDRLEEWENGPKRIRLVRDRGQWFVLVSRDEWNDWFELDLVSWVTESKEDTVVGRLAAACWADLDHLLPALQGAREQRAHDRFRSLPRRHPYNNGEPS